MLVTASAVEAKEEKMPKLTALQRKILVTTAARRRRGGDPREAEQGGCLTIERKRREALPERRR